MFNITAFLQNPWFKPGTEERIIQLYRNDQTFHRRILLNTKSGGILYSCFGQTLWNHIHWDNVAWKSGQTSKDVQPPDMPHVRFVLESTRPLLVISFGHKARTAVQAAFDSDQCWYTHFTSRHPTSFGMSHHEMETRVKEIQALIAKICVEKGMENELV